MISSFLPVMSHKIKYTRCHCCAVNFPITTSGSHEVEQGRHVPAVVAKSMTQVFLLNTIREQKKQDCCLNSKNMPLLMFATSQLSLCIVSKLVLMINLRKCQCSTSNWSGHQFTMARVVIFWVTGCSHISLSYGGHF